jgi:hypothetical protein
MSRAAKRCHEIDTLCPLCERHTALTFHHLIPRKLHRRQHFLKHYTREQRNAGTMICRQCHDGIHRLFDEMTLGKHLNTLAALREEPRLMRHVQWVARQKLRTD